MTINVDNLVDNFVFNTAAIFEGNWQSLGVVDVYKDDVWIVPHVPSLSISCSSFWNDLRTIGSSNVRYEFDFIGNVWYYHSAVNPDITTNMVMRNAYKVVEHIIKNASLNGFLTNTRALVRSCSYLPRRRSGAILSGARIVITAPYQTRISTIS